MGGENGRPMDGWSLVWLVIELMVADLANWYDCQFGTYHLGWKNNVHLNLNKPFSVTRVCWQYLKPSVTETIWISDTDTHGTTAHQGQIESCSFCKHLHITCESFCEYKKVYLQSYWDIKYCIYDPYIQYMIIYRIIKAQDSTIYIMRMDFGLSQSEGQYASDIVVREQKCFQNRAGMYHHPREIYPLPVLQEESPNPVVVGSLNRHSRVFFVRCLTLHHFTGLGMWHTHQIWEPKRPVVYHPFSPWFPAVGGAKALRQICTGGVWRVWTWGQLSSVSRSLWVWLLNKASDFLGVFHFSLFFFICFQGLHGLHTSLKTDVVQRSDSLWSKPHCSKKGGANTTDVRWESNVQQGRIFLKKVDVCNQK